MYKDETESGSKWNIWTLLHMTNTAYGVFNLFSHLKISGQKFSLSLIHINNSTELEMQKPHFKPTVPAF